MTFASSRVETYVLPSNLAAVIRDVETLVARGHRMPTVTLGRSTYKSLADVIARQSDGRMTLEQCTIHGIAITPLTPVRRAAQPGLFR